MAQKFKCLNPVGIQNPISQHALTPRLDTLDGKTIFVCVNAGGDQDITIPLVKKLPEYYPKTNWKIKRQFGFSARLTEEERKICDGMLAGVIW
jgi:hypothetical protein